MPLKSLRMSPYDLEYRPRVVDAELQTLLSAGGAVLIEGPRACGKTETARQVAASEVSLETDAFALAASKLDPSILLDGPTPRLIDEWQLVPAIWSHIRRDVDAHGGEPGRFVLTGSAVPADDSTRHSGAGRILRLRMRPMSLFEGGQSTGEVGLQALFNGLQVRASKSPLRIREIATLISIGGWPALQGRPYASAAPVVRGYLNEVARADVQRVDGVRRDPTRVRRLMRSLARYTSTAASARAIASNVGDVNSPMKAHTALEYLDALDRIFVLEDLPAWAPSLRSKSRIREAGKRHFVDPSLAAAALGAGPDRLLREVDTVRPAVGLDRPGAAGVPRPARAPARRRPRVPGPRQGHEILATGALPTVDTWTFIVAGTTWVDQQWLAQVLLAAGHAIGGWELLVGGCAPSLWSPRPG